MQEFLISILSLSVGGSLIALPLLALLRLPNKLPKSICYYAWLLVLLRLALPIPGLLELERQVPPPAAVTQVQELPQPKEMIIPTMPLMTGEAPIPQPEAPGAVPEKPFPVWEALGVVWALGFAVFLGRDVIGYFRFRRGLHKTLKQPRPSDLAVFDSLAGKKGPMLGRSGAVDSPMLMGIFRPLLLLPDRDYDPAVLNCIFRHELTHYSRGDILYKWFAMVVLSLHWFNPLGVLIRREVDRCCELSCDERILKEMDLDQRRSYGQTLLVLAARTAPQKTPLATSFSTEKKKLKERLVQIMNFSPKSKWTIFAAALLILIIAISCLLLGPAREEKPGETVPETAQEQTEPVREIDASDNEVTVSTVDELLAAIRSDTTIILEPGTYDLTQAGTYGQSSGSSAYRWAECTDGYALIIDGVKNLTIMGRDRETCEIVTGPRYAAVMYFKNCVNITLTSLTSGHTEGAGDCVGPVVMVDFCENVDISDCVLYGCGTYGVHGHSSNKIKVLDCDIKECSQGAGRFALCTNVEIQDCKVFDCGSAEAPALEMFYFDECGAAAVQNCEITNNFANVLVGTEGSAEIYFLGNRTESTTASTVFRSSGDDGTMVEGCSFDLTGVSKWIEGGNSLMSPAGEGLDQETLMGMTHRRSNFVLPDWFRHITEAPAATEEPEGDGFLPAATEESEGDEFQPDQLPATLAEFEEDLAVQENLTVQDFRRNYETAQNLLSSGVQPEGEMAVFDPHNRGPLSAEELRKRNEGIMSGFYYVALEKEAFGIDRFFVLPAGQRPMTAEEYLLLAAACDLSAKELMEPQNSWIPLQGSRGTTSRGLSQREQFWLKFQLNEIFRQRGVDGTVQKDLPIGTYVGCGDQRMAFVILPSGEMDESALQEAALRIYQGTVPEEERHLWRPSEEELTWQEAVEAAVEYMADEGRTEEPAKDYVSYSSQVTDDGDRTGRWLVALYYADGGSYMVELSSVSGEFMSMEQLNDGFLDITRTWAPDEKAPR